MKSLQSFFSKNRELSIDSTDDNTQSTVDDKTVFYVFSRIISEEYGRKGEKAIIPSFYRNRIIFVRFSESLWAQEVWTNRQYLIRRLNERVGQKVVVNIKPH